MTKTMSRTRAHFKDGRLESFQSAEDILHQLGPVPHCRKVCVVRIARVFHGVLEHHCKRFSVVTNCACVLINASSFARSDLLRDHGEHYPVRHSEDEREEVAGHGTEVQRSAQAVVV